MGSVVIGCALIWIVYGVMVITIVKKEIWDK